MLLLVYQERFKLKVTVEGLVAVVNLMVVLSVVVTSGGTFVGDRTLGVVVMFVAMVIFVIVVAGVALVVDTTRVVTFSWCVVGLGRAVEVVGYCGDQGEGG